MMIQPSVGRQNDPLPLFAQSEAVINVIEVYREVDGVHSSDRKIIASACEQACRCDRATFMRRKKHFGIAQIIV
jgi:hypothetical protein